VHLCLIVSVNPAVDLLSSQQPAASQQSAPTAQPTNQRPISPEALPPSICGVLPQLLLPLRSPSPFADRIAHRRHSTATIHADVESAAVPGDDVATGCIPVDPTTPAHD